jgi:TrmH family RNA methyltransferase
VRDLERLITKREEAIRVFAADKNLLEQLTGFSMYQGLLAVGRVPEPTTLEHLLSGGTRPHLFVAVDGLSSAENLGAIVRNCGAFGIHGLLVSQTSCSPFLRRAVRSSMGVVFRLPIVEGLDLPATLQELRDKGIRCVAAHPRTSSRLLCQSDLQGDCCLIFGSEGAGISDEVLSVCDETVAIPMSSDVDSLNVANAAAAFLYEAHRQRSRGNHPGAFPENL